MKMRILTTAAILGALGGVLGPGCNSSEETAGTRPQGNSETTPNAGESEGAGARGGGDAAAGRAQSSLGGSENAGGNADSTEPGRGGGSPAKGAGGASPTTVSNGDGSGGQVPRSSAQDGANPANGAADAGDASASDAASTGTVPSTVAPVSSFTTSCETQKCASDEKCITGGFGGTYCARPCAGQRTCASGMVSYCERNGGVICAPK